MASIRRNSVTNLGEKTRSAFSGQPQVPGPGLCYREDFATFMDTFIEVSKAYNKFGWVRLEENHNFSDYIFRMIDDVRYNLVAILCAYKHPVERPDGITIHAVPYVKMNDYWYEGDNEKGVLRLRMNGPPIWTHKYGTGIQMEMGSMIYFYVNILVPIFPIPPLNNYGFHGKIVSKQNGTTCWTDSIQTILMNANGYREQFTHLYNLAKTPPFFDPGVIITSEETIKTFMKKLKSIFDIQEITTPAIINTLNILSLIFTRVFFWKLIEYPTNYVTHKPGTPEFLQPNKSDGALVNVPNMSLRNASGNIHVGEHFGGKRLKNHRKTYKRKN